MWIDNVSQQHLEEAEKSATDYISLGKLLLQIIFSKELGEAESWCCTKSKGRKVLDQEKLHGIRCKINVIEIFMCMQCPPFLNSSHN